jgi:hypothetical protein
MKKLPLRLSDEEHAALKKEAEKNKRSMNAQILFMIEQMIKG